MSDNTPLPPVLLRKPLTEVVNKEQPWKDDELERQKIAKIIAKILATTNQPLVVSIDAPYGTGKTFFVTRLYYQLLNEGYACAFINAWETDFIGDPFTAIMSELTEQLAELGLVDAPNSTKSIARRVGSYIVRRSLPAVVKKVTASPDYS
jgi:hypothetical protein